MQAEPDKPTCENLKSSFSGGRLQVV